ncbi:hypothetical protein PanWU01x14_009510 [Parasponia andersonii]|uniref:Uncharacterized protein n=1 Tax=Parasponia andersonii TaxID=3476 RepID=A0A2P5E2E8_PARAD|nr:hypothetical protein PanWU01x14_009510 [Parasponia andersonii]
MGRPRPEPNPSQTLDSSAQSSSCLGSWELEASRVFCQKTIEGNPLLKTQTGYLMQSWIGAHIGQIVLTKRWFVKVSPPTGVSRRGRRKESHANTREITVIMARDLWTFIDDWIVLSSTPEFENSV